MTILVFRLVVMALLFSVNLLAWIALCLWLDWVGLAFLFPISATLSFLNEKVWFYGKEL